MSLPLRYIINQINNAKNNPATMPMPAVNIDIADHPQFVENAAVLITALLIAGVLYPISTVEQLLQTGRLLSLGRGSDWLATVYAALNGTAFKSSAKASLIKNGLIAKNKGETINHADGKAENEHTAVATGYLWLKACFLISTTETFLTTYFSNMRILSNRFDPRWETELHTAHMQRLHNLSPIDRLKIAPNGMPLRWTKSLVNAACCIGTNALKEQLHLLFPQEKFGSMAEHLSVIMAGSFAGVTTNLFEVIYKNQIRQMDMEKFSSPKWQKIVADIYQKSGNAGFMKGAGMSILSTTIAYYLINFVGKQKDKLLSQPTEISLSINSSQPQRPSAAMPSLFHSSFFKATPELTQNESDKLFNQSGLTFGY